MYRSDIEQEAKPESVSEKLSSSFGGDPAKQESMREEMEAWRSIFEDVSEEAKAAREAAEREMEGRASSKEVERLRDRVDELERIVGDLVYLVRRAKDTEYRCPNCHTEVKETLTTVDPDPGDGSYESGLRCPNCDNFLPENLDEATL
jgi:DNA-directed RNA polymerase subunit RPC12/RpoP